MTSEIASFCAGNFWHAQLKFSKVEGVLKTTVGYQGGKLAYPSFNEVASGKTGHVQTVLIHFDPSIISYRDLLEVFWSMHDPSNNEGQGEYKGAEYKSTIFYHTEQQQVTAEESKQKLENSKKYSTPIITEIKKAARFYPAEEIHQFYFLKSK